MKDPIQIFYSEQREELSGPVFFSFFSLMILVAEMFCLSSAAHVALEVGDQVEDTVEEERSDGPGTSSLC